MTYGALLPADETGHQHSGMEIASMMLWDEFTDVLDTWFLCRLKVRRSESLSMVQSMLLLFVQSCENVSLPYRSYQRR